MRAREDLNIDTRTATEYGVVRTFFDGVVLLDDWRLSGHRQRVRHHRLQQHACPQHLRCRPRRSLVRRSTATTAAPRAARSACTTPSSSSLASRWVRPCRSSTRPGPTIPGNNYDGLVGGCGTVTGVNQFTYTADFGQGVTAAFSAEDRAAYYDAGNLNFDWRSWPRLA